MEAEELKKLAKKAREAGTEASMVPNTDGITSALIIAESNYAIAKAIESAAEQIHNIYCRMEH